MASNSTGWLSVIDKVEEEETREVIYPWWYSRVGSEDISAWWARLAEWSTAVWGWTQSEESLPSGMRHA